MEKITFIIGLVLSCALCTSCEVFTAQQENDVENLINDIMTCRNIPGLMLSVVRGNDSWSRGFGFADVENGRRVDNTTVFQIASLTKAMTMALLARKLKENGYDWNTKLRDMPGGELYEFPPEIPQENVTLVDLLAHRTGLSGLVTTGFFGGYPAGTTREQMARRIKFIPVVEEFREDFEYNNFMYLVLGHVTETLGGDSWENLLMSQLLEPIGLSDTSVLESNDDVYRSNSAKPYIYKDERIQPGTYGLYTLAPFQSAGNVMSNGIDMAKWMQFNLNNGKTKDGEQLIDLELFRQAFQEHNVYTEKKRTSSSYTRPTYPADDVTSSYGLAWNFTGSYRGHRRVWHSGGLHSYISYMWLFPEEGIGMIAASNGPTLPSVSGRSMKSIFWYITDMFLGYEPWISASTGCTFEAPWVNKTKSTRGPHDVYTNANMTSFIGTYVSDLFPDVKISRDESSAENERLKFELSRFSGYIYPEQNDGLDFGFEQTEPWEWAIKYVKNENYTKRFPVRFVLSENNDTVVGMNVEFESRAWISFEKVVESDQTGGGNSIHKFLLAINLFLFYIIYLVTV